MFSFEARLGVILGSEAGIVQASPCPVVVVAERHGPGDVGHISWQLEYDISIHSYTVLLHPCSLS